MSDILELDDLIKEGGASQEAPVYSLAAQGTLPLRTLVLLYCRAPESIAFPNWLAGYRALVGQLGLPVAEKAQRPWPPRFARWDLQQVAIILNADCSAVHWLAWEIENAHSI